MASIAEVMRILQFGDSVVPVGAFAFSNGLESAIQQKIVHDPASLREFVATAARQAATGDGIALLHAHRAARAGDRDGVIRCDRAIHNRKLNEETRLMTVRMGRKLAEMGLHVFAAPVLADWLGAVKAGEAPGCHPVAQALVFAALELSEQDAFAVHQCGLASMMLGAALRLMKLSHLDAQAILFDLNAGSEALYRRIAPLGLDDMQGFAPVQDILAAVHVKAHVRMFMN
jgi:urease accessory protein